jgi:uncharacterized membrane protein
VWWGPRHGAGVGGMWAVGWGSDGVGGWEEGFRLGGRFFFPSRWFFGSVWNWTLPSFCFSTSHQFIAVKSDFNCSFHRLLLCLLINFYLFFRNLINSISLICLNFLFHMFKFLKYEENHYLKKNQGECLIIFLFFGWILPLSQNTCHSRLFSIY